VCRQVGQSEISIHQDEDEVMNQLVVGAFFMHPDEGLSICKEWIQVRDSPPAATFSALLTSAVQIIFRCICYFLENNSGSYS